jgi:hypothetical protein
MNMLGLSSSLRIAHIACSRKFFLLRFIRPLSVQALDSLILAKVKVKVTLRMTASQSVSLGVEPHLLLFDNYGLVFVWRPL